MEYDVFIAEYDRVHDGWSYGHLPAENVVPEIDRLREWAARIEVADDREYAEYLLTRWRSAVDGPQADRIGRAFEVYVNASRASGDDDERMTQYRLGISRITEIADETDDESEQATILAYNESLSMSIHSIEYDRERPAGP
jgi:hypothetical protein